MDSIIITVKNNYNNYIWWKYIVHLKNCVDPELCNDGQ